MALMREVHEHHGAHESGMGFLMGVILLIVALFLFFYYGLPMLRSAATPQVTIPGKIDVNINQK